MAILFSSDKIKERIIFENPWWKDHKIDPRYSHLEHRFYFHPFHQLILSTRPTRAVILMGPRRVGKTVMIYQSIQSLIEAKVPAKNICFISIDTPIYTGCLLEELLQLFISIHGHLASSPLYVFFDEIQYLPNWEIHLKSLVDSYPSIKFCVSGSAAAVLKLRSIESGAGRFTDFVLPPLTFSEYLGIRKTNPALFAKTKRTRQLNEAFIRYINFGGYPEVSSLHEVQDNIERYVMNDIVEKVLLKDIPNLYGIQNVQELKSFFNYIAYHTGSEFSIEALANQSGIAKNTIKKYIEYLEASFLVKKLSRIEINARQFKRESTFKLYITNPTLRSALFSPIGEDDPFIGHLVENTVLSQILHENPRNLYYARWKKGELDFVWLDNLQRPVNAVEVKWSDKTHEDSKELKKIAEFCHLHELHQVTVTTKTYHGIKTFEGITFTFIPTSVFCLFFTAKLHARKTYTIPPSDTLQIVEEFLG